ncbi:MAG: hypothetical protein ACE5LC_09835 [Candidatus Aminicenantales bacterium]
MRRLVSCLIIAVLIFLPLLGRVALSQTLGFGFLEKKQNIWGNYSVSGTIGVNFLFDNVQGERNLYLSQFNLQSGIKFSSLSFKANRIPDREGIFDSISFDVRGFGAEPYGRAEFRLEKRNLLLLRGGYTERKYFTNVAIFANPLFDPDSEITQLTSYHTWNTKEKTTDISGRLRVAPWLSLDVSWQRTKLEGNSVITLRLLNNEYPLNEPVNQTINVVQLGSEINVKGILFYKVTGIYNTFSLDQEAYSQTAVNWGLRGNPYGDSGTYLTNQERDISVNLRTWTINQSFHIVPFRNISINGSLRKSWASGESQSQEVVEGRFVWPLYDIVSSAVYSNSGDLKKDLCRGDVGVYFDLLPNLRVRAGYDFYSYTIENSDLLSYSFYRVYYGRTVTESENSNPLIGMKYGKFFADASFTIGKHVTVSGGYAYSTNKLELRSAEGEEEDYSYNLSSYFGSLAFKLNRVFSLKATYEKGNYNRVFARLIPLDSSSAAVQGKFTLAETISCSFHYKYQKLENAPFGYDSTLNGYGASVRYSAENGLFGAFANFSKNDFNSVLDIIRYVSLFVETDDISEFVSDSLHFSAGLWLKLGIVGLNAGYSYTKTEGTFPIKMQFPYISLMLKVLPELAFTVNYRLYDHSQIDYPTQYYKAHLLTIGFLTSL